MDDSVLSKYLNKVGDRIALQTFCKKMKESSEDAITSSRKLRLLDRLRFKLADEGNIEENKNEVTGEYSANHEDSYENRPTCKKRRGNTNAFKEQRQVEFAWLHSTRTGGMKQVYKKGGGGTRKFSVSRNWVRENLLEAAVKLYFNGPNGTSSVGSRDDMLLDIYDYKRCSLNDKVTVGQLYSESKLSLLRFYLVSIVKTSVDEKPSTSELTTPVDDILDISCATPSTSELTTVSDEELPDLIPGEETILYPHVTNVGLKSDESFQIMLDDEVIYLQMSIDAPAAFENVTDTLEGDNNPNGDLSASQEQASFIGQFAHGEGDQEDRPTMTLKVHRGMAFQDLMKHFSQPKVQQFNGAIRIQMILLSGEPEKGEDDGGVLRDCLTEFWNTFYDTCTTGCDTKVPYLRHDYSANDWKSIAHVLLVGWRLVDYLPRICLPFLQYSFNGTAAVSESLVEDFMSYISVSERDVLITAMKDYESMEHSEIIEVLQNYDCKRAPTATNFKQIIEEIAHVELIQKAAFIADCWNSVLANLVSNECLYSRFNDLKPTVRGVLKRMVPPIEEAEMNVQDKTVWQYLLRFIRELEAGDLKKFLRFCTGADILIVSKISVTFSDLEGFQRRPIAHTCGCVLEIPRSYESYPAFRSEFKKLLESDIWVMDLV
jgi:hypothetical protein